MPKSGVADRRAPRIVELPARTMAVVHTRGDPNETGPKVIPALYGAVYTLKFANKRNGHDFKVEPLRARWLGSHLDDDGQLVGNPEGWEGAWALPVPEGTTEIHSKDPSVPIAIEKWSYGTVAQILHEGSYREESPTVARLLAFIAANGYEVVGPHEEEYLTRPDAKVPKTIIRYEIRPAQPASHDGDTNA